MTMTLKKMSGAGRFKPASRVRDVESALCPAWTGCHELTNDRGANTYCVHCSGSWAAIVAGLRASVESVLGESGRAS